MDHKTYSLKLKKVIDGKEESRLDFFSDHLKPVRRYFDPNYHDYRYDVGI
jgi:hypothetical protein